MPEFEYRGVQFKEAIANLRDKIPVPTERYDQWMGAANAKGFIVAGANKLDLVKEFQQSMVEAIENGETLGQFREKFRDIVNKNGWTYKGKEGWRSKVIYTNNMRTAAMAGRWEKIQARKKTFPYLIYMTVGDERVRADHRIWHQTALPVDDPWWNSHYPPNDYGCRCYVISANDRQLKRMGLEVSEAPKVTKSERVIPSTGEVYGDVPDGIGTGWEYNVGKAWLGPDIALGQKLAQLPTELRVIASKTVDDVLLPTSKSWKSWLNSIEAEGKATGAAHAVGWIDTPVFDALLKSGVVADSLAIVVFDNQINHLIGIHKAAKAANLPRELLDDLPNQLRNYQAILRHKATGNIVYVLPDSVGGKQGRAVVHINFKKKGEVFNSVRSLGVVQAAQLKSKKDYEVLLGEIK